MEEYKNQKSTNNQILLETKLVGSIEGDFFISSYQRGYRWGKEEVIRLLDDIYSNGKKNYCLQPVVVRKNEDSFELIDGQQRLTTLYLIYRYMQNQNTIFNEPAFSLRYETREKSEDFLREVDMSRREENIDFWFIANAYETIREWFEFEAQMQIRVMHIFEYLKENVKVIWYEVGAEADEIALFTRLNIGKIPLTSAELVKAMFICSNSENEVPQEKKEEIALQWDNMERELHQDSFWYFLSNQVDGQYQTRIDLVLNLIANKPANSREKYYTFFRFDDMRCDMSLDDIWKKIHQTFLILKDWFEDHELYHKIGYLIASGTVSLMDIFRVTDQKKKDEFQTTLDEMIRKSIRIKDNYAELSYENKTDYVNISRLLLLFNVESVRQNGAHSQWFPFDKFKYDKGGKVSWSLEHIHAQQSEGMRKQEMWKEWLKLHIPSVKQVSPESKELVQRMEDAFVKDRLDRAEFDELQQRVLMILSVGGNIEYMHSVANLALLNSSDNAALNNSTFDVKRNVIIEMDKRGQYIPFCTKMVFLKYYTPSDKNQLHFWGQADRDAYVRAMNEVLRNYLEEPIRMEMEEG